MRRRDWIILIIAAVFALAAVWGVFRGSVLQTGSWGLSFRQEHTPPIGNAG